MERLITSDLIRWKDNKHRKPLIVRGARQVGKSYSIVDFGKRSFDGATHVINFEKHPEYNKVFDGNFDVLRILGELEILLNSKIRAGTDLLFFDEVQECPNAIVSLRYFYEQLPELHVVAAGSLLEFALGEVSFPVGRVHLLNMYPMSFYEFLNASGKNIAAEQLKDRPKRLADTVHNLLNEELRKFFFIGGMPECVKIYAETGSMVDVFEIQSDLLATFRQDFNKYGGRVDKSCMNTVLTTVSQKTGEQIKYTSLAEGFSTSTIKKSFELLENARLFHRVRASSPAGVPLGAGASEKKFKTVMLDIGLMANLSGINVAKAYASNDLLSMFRGKLAEQFVGQELLCSTKSGLYYWSRDARGSSAEVDYMVESLGKVVPVEVKSGRGGSLKSLNLLLDTFESIDNACVLSDNPYHAKAGEKVKFLPLYFAGIIANSPI